MNSLFLAAIIATMPLPEGKVKLYDHVADCDRGRFVELVESRSKVVDTGCWWRSDDGSSIVVKWKSVNPSIYYKNKRFRFYSASVIAASVVATIIADSDEYEDKPISP